MSRLGMMEGVSQRFAPDPIDLIAYQRPLLSRGAFDNQAHFGSAAMAGIARELLGECLDGFPEFVRLDCGGPQSLHGLSPFSKRLSGLIDSILENRSRLIGTL